MKKYPPESWAALGDWIQDARLRVDGFRDMKDWAKAVGRSTRQLADLERGQSVGVGTLERVADALGIERSVVFDRLAGQSPPRTDATRPGSELTDEELISLLAYRLGRAANQKEVPSDGNDSNQKTLSAVPDVPDTSGMRGPDLDVDKLAADRTKEKSEGQRLRDEQDADAQQGDE